MLFHSYALQKKHCDSFCTESKKFSMTSLDPDGQKNAVYSSNFGHFTHQGENYLVESPNHLTIRVTQSC